MRSFLLSGLLTVTVAILALVLGGLASGAVPDKLLCDAQPSVMHASLGYGNASLNRVTVQLATDEGVPVKMCGVMVECESQNPDILQWVWGGASFSERTDEFGRVEMTFKSSGNGRSNLGPVEIICRSPQQKPCSTHVDVKLHLPDALGLSACPWTNDPDDTEADIIADGESKVRIAAQLLRSYGGKLIPVKIEGVNITFRSLNTNYLEECVSDRDGDGLGLITEPTNSEGVAYAEFCSAGSGSENEGTATIEVQPDGGYGIPQDTIKITTTRDFLTTSINGKLYMSFTPLHIRADQTSTFTACVQLREESGEIIKDPPPGTVTFASLTAGLTPFLTTENENPQFEQGGIYTATYASHAGERNIIIQASRSTFSDVTGNLESVSSQSWPFSFDLTASPEEVLCDGVSEVKITAQLLDEDGYPVFMEKRKVVFTSSDTSKLESREGGASATIGTSKFGLAAWLFKVKDCKSDGADEGTVRIDVSTISDEVSGSIDVQVFKPEGYLPNGISAYTDQSLEHRDGDHLNPGFESHTSPSLISADGRKPVYVTAQVCEWVTDDFDGGGEGDRNRDRDSDGNTDEEFCNPVKRKGIRVEFRVENPNIIRNYRDFPGQSDPEDSLSTVYLNTDEEGTATAVFRSSGTTPDTNEGCTNVIVTAQDGSILDGPAYSRVCAVQHESMTPNAVWIWAQPAFITADGVSHTTIRAALYQCEKSFISTSQLHPGYVQKSSPGTPQSPYGALIGITPDDLKSHCRPAQYENALVKFESMDPIIINNGMGGKTIYAYTNEYGQAESTFQSAGFQEPNIGPSEIRVFVDLGSAGEDVTQLNYLQVTAEEKTWPWCPPKSEWLTCGADDADLNRDHRISDSELLKYVVRWLNSNLGTDDICADYPKYWQPCPEDDPCSIDQRLIEAITTWQA